MAQVLSGDRISYLFEPSTALTEYTQLANEATALATLKGLGPGKAISLTVLHKGRRDTPSNVIRYHELIVSVRPPSYYSRGLMWMGSLVEDTHYRLFHVCITDPPVDAQWVIIPDVSYVYDPEAYVDYLDTLGGVGGGGSAPSSGIITLEALAAGDFVNVVPNISSGVRKADASDPDKEATGYVKASYSAGVPAVVYFSGINDKVTGQTPGPVFLSTTPGLASSDPSALISGQLRQRVGTAITPTSINFQPDISIILA